MYLTLKQVSEDEDEEDEDEEDEDGEGGDEGDGEDVRMEDADDPKQKVAKYSNKQVDEALEADIKMTEVIQEEEEEEEVENSAATTVDDGLPHPRVGHVHFVSSWITY